MILTSIKESFREAKNKNWSRLYYYFDIHKTIIKPDYEYGGKLEFYPYAKETLQILSELPNFVLGLYTCSYPEEIGRYQEFFIQNRIFFTQVNKNTEVANTRYGYFEQKFYFNLIVDDKAGFRPKEWKQLYEFFKPLKDKIDEEIKLRNIEREKFLPSIILSINKTKSNKSTVLYLDKNL